MKYTAILALVAFLAFIAYRIIAGKKADAARNAEAFANPPAAPLPEPISPEQAMAEYIKQQSGHN